MARAREFSAAHHEHFSSDSGFRVSSDRTFGLVFCVCFAAVAVLPLMRTRPVRWWAVAASVAFLAAALGTPRILHPLNLAWARLALLLHHIVSPIAMAVLFFFGFALPGIVLRMSGKDLLRLKAAPDQDTYWIQRDPPGPAPESMLQQF